MSLTVFAYGQNGIRFEKRGDRVWVSLTDMAKANGKLVADWQRLKSTSEFLQELESVMGIPITETIQGGTPQKQGTWAIEEVAIDFAAWCNVRFRIWVMQQIKDLLNGGGAIAPPQFSSYERATTVNNLAASLQFFDIEVCNPRFKQEMQDLVGDILGLTKPKLPGSVEIWLGVAERAEQLGYAVHLVTQHRSQLGKYVKACGLKPTQESRLCNGTQRPINLYLQCVELDTAIAEFLDAKILAGG